MIEEYDFKKEWWVIVGLKYYGLRWVIRTFWHGYCHIPIYGGEWDWKNKALRIIGA